MAPKMAPIKGLLHQLPTELRLQVLKLFFSTVDRQQGQALLQALRSSSSTASTIYLEAIQIYHRMHAFTMTSRNEVPNTALGTMTHDSTLNLEIKFSISFNISAHTNAASIITSRSRLTLRKWSPSAPPTAPAPPSQSSNSARTAAIRQEFSAPQPVFNERIRPLPSYKTVAAFANLRVLRLDAVVVRIKLFHTLTALVAEAVRTCKRLERVEVKCLDGQPKHGVMSNCSCAACADPSGNDDWVSVLNRSIGVRAKLMVVTGGQPAAFVTEGVALLDVGGESAGGAASALSERGEEPVGQVMWWFWDRMDGSVLRREKKKKRMKN